jgi:hypothetical protein
MTPPDLRGPTLSILGSCFSVAVREAQLVRRCCLRPATLLPCPALAGCRPVALRPTLSSGLPLSGFERSLLRITLIARSDVEVCMNPEQEACHRNLKSFPCAERHEGRGGKVAIPRMSYQGSGVICLMIRCRRRQAATEESSHRAKNAGDDAPLEGRRL